MPQTFSYTPRDHAPTMPPSTDQLALSLPFLRRYARAATGSRTRGDALVHSMLEAALRDRIILRQISESRTSLFKVFTTKWSLIDPLHDVAAATPEQRMASQLARVPSLRRQALLLNEFEEFSLIETGEILGISEVEAANLVAAALNDISREEPAHVLIIEDEPIVAHHLEDIVSRTGHRIVANATTADEARKAYDHHKPTLILSDVQLADGSSGIDAVEDILRNGPIPVIFITGFPQKLLTGGGYEPTFLITKPFREDTVRTTISQALFFGAALID